MVLHAPCTSERVRQRAIEQVGRLVCSSSSRLTPTAAVVGVKMQKMLHNIHHITLFCNRLEGSFTYISFISSVFLLFFLSLNIAAAATGAVAVVVNVDVTDMKW